MPSRRSFRPRWLALALLLFTPPPQARAAESVIAHIDVAGTAFRVSLADGRELTGPDLVGAKLDIRMSDAGAPIRVRLADIRPDADHPGGDVLLHRMMLIDPRGGAERDLCGPDAKGEHWAFPLRGQWDAEGQRVSDSGFTLACGGDALGKCVRFGYLPWKTLPDGTDLAPYHQACVRMVRADYCGGRGTTRNGMLIDFHDRLGINRPTEPPQAGLRFEAAWTSRGAACVAHTRVPENMTLERLAATCPRLRGHLGERNCTEIGAVDSGFGSVLFFNKSR